MEPWGLGRQWGQGTLMPDSVGKGEQEHGQGQAEQKWLKLSGTVELTAPESFSFLSPSTPKT